MIVKYAPATSASQRDTAAKGAGVLERLGSVTRVGAQVVRVTGDPRQAAGKTAVCGGVTSFGVLSVKRGGGYVAFSGTSMATPHAAGVAALIRGKFPSLTAAQARAKLDAGVDDLGAAGRDSSFGFGRVTLTKALL